MNTIHKFSARILLAATGIFAANGFCGPQAFAKSPRLNPNTTIYGQVKADGKPLKDVVVSDGIEVVTTDSRGYYQIPSKKESGLVFISVPGGYEPETAGVFPTIYSVLTKDSLTAETSDFNLRKRNQDKYKVLFLGDIHLAAQTDDVEQFRLVTDDINKYKSANSDIPVYGVTLGDMTWDIYWDQFTLADYVKEINNDIKDMVIYQTIGNHDNDYRTTDNAGAKNPYKTTVAPNYYSFNIGKTHYVVLDDIDCSDYDGSRKRDYKKRVFIPQLEWLARDLEHVDRDTPLVIVMHAPLYTCHGLTEYTHNLKNGRQLLEVLDGRPVHFVSGHIHNNYNVTPEMEVTEGKPIHEHNVAAVCSDWWWSGHLTPGCLVSLDGTPSGYSVWTWTGGKPEYIYKSVGHDESHQFRSYDLNNVRFTRDDVPELKHEKALERWDEFCKAHDGSQKNEILLNVWNWNPSWNVSVTTTDGRQLEVTPISTYDPLHLEAKDKKYYNADWNRVPGFSTKLAHHFFKTTAPDADTDVVITVSDEFGNTWTETMERPKAFNTEVYATPALKHR